MLVGKFDAAMMFVDVCDSVRLYDTLGDQEASRRIMECLESLRPICHNYEGKVLQRVGDELVCLFPNSNSSVEAAGEMQRTTQSLQSSESNPISLRVGLHYGPVLLRDGDPFGDTVNVASRVASTARHQQIYVTPELAESLDTLRFSRLRSLGAFALKGKPLPVNLYEYIWRTDSRTITQLRTVPGSMDYSRLLLKYGGKIVVLRAIAGETILLGRDKSCHIVLDHVQASRKHAEIFYRMDHFVLVDRSVNGTLISIGNDQLRLRHEELILSGAGEIQFGSTLDSVSAPPVEFIVL